AVTFGVNDFPLVGNGHRGAGNLVLGEETLHELVEDLEFRLGRAGVGTDEVSRRRQASMLKKSASRCCHDVAPCWNRFNESQRRKSKYASSAEAPSLRGRQWNC